MSTIFVWEGVTMYLTEEAVRKTLEQMIQATTSDVFVIFDYFTRHIQSAHENEPFKYFIEDPMWMLTKAGFSRVRRARMDELHQNMFGKYLKLTAGGCATAACLRSAKYDKDLFFI